MSNLEWVENIYLPFLWSIERAESDKYIRATLFTDLGYCNCLINEGIEPDDSMCTEFNQYRCDHLGEDCENQYGT